MLNPSTPQNARNHEGLKNFLRDINTFLEGTNPDDFENGKLEKIFVFLNSERSVGMDSKDFVEIIKGAGFEYDRDKLSLIDNFFKSERSKGINGEDFVKIIKGAGFEYDRDKLSLIDIFFKSERSEGINGKDFVEIIKGAGFKNDLHKLSLIDNFFKSERSVGINHIQFIEFIKVAEFIDDRDKRESISNFLSSDRSSGINVEDFVEIIKVAEFKDDRDKRESISDFLSSQRSSNMTLEDFAKMIKEVGFQYQVDKTIELYKNKFSSSENYIKNFFNIVKELNPSETMQCKFLEAFILNTEVNQDNFEYLKPFIKELKDDENVFLIINTLKNRGVLNEEKDILDLLGGRVRKQYTFLTEIVDKKSLENCIDATGIATLKRTFGEDLKIGDKPINIADLFAYYDCKNQTSTLSTMLKPEFKKELRDNFALSAEMLLYKSAELDKLNQLLGERGVSFDVKNHLLENAKLCDYLKEKVGDISEIDHAKTYQIKFANFGIEEEKKAEINTLFNRLLQSPNPDKEEVATFFKDLIGFELDENGISHKKDDLANFFKDYKKEIVHCFCNQNLKKGIFLNLLITLSDGCYANIGMQFRKALYGAMIEDEQAKILYGVADTQIFSVIANKELDITHAGSPVNNSIIKSYLLSPMRLVEKLSQEESLNINKASEIIEANINRDDFERMLVRLQEKTDEMSVEAGGEFLNQKAKEIASYLIVKKVFGEEKIKDLTSKNPQLRELGDFVYDRALNASPEASPQLSQQASSRGGCFSCFRLGTRDR